MPPRSFLERKCSVLDVQKSVILYTYVQFLLSSFWLSVGTKMTVFCGPVDKTMAKSTYFLLGKFVKKYSCFQMRTIRNIRTNIYNGMGSIHVNEEASIHNSVSIGPFTTILDGVTVLHICDSSASRSAPIFFSS